MQHVSAAHAYLHCSLQSDQTNHANTIQNTSHLCLHRHYPRGRCEYEYEYEHVHEHEHELELELEHEHEHEHEHECENTYVVLRT